VEPAGWRSLESEIIRNKNGYYRLHALKHVNALQKSPLTLAFFAEG
jgi:hypothetical protein